MNSGFLLGKSWPIGIQSSINANFITNGFKILLCIINLLMNVGPVFEIAYGECGGPFIGRPLPTVNAALWGRRDADLASSDVVPSLTTCPIFHHHPGLSSVRSEEKCSLTHTSPNDNDERSIEVLPMRSECHRPKRDNGG